MFGIFDQPQQQAPQPVGPGGRIIRGIESGLRGVRQAGDREAIIGEAVQRFEALGSEESLRMAEMLKGNPRAAWTWMKELGGPAKVHSMMKANALRARANRGMMAGGTEQSVDELARRLGGDVDLAIAALQPVANLRKTLAEAGKAGREPNRQMRKAADDRWRYADTGELVFPGVKSTKGLKDLTPDQAANARETLAARKWLRDWMQINNKSAADMRPVISGGADPWFPEKGPEDKLVAMQWAKASQAVPIDDPGWDSFMEQIIGSNEPPPWEQRKGAPQAARELPDDPNEWVHGQLYEIRDEKGNDVEAYWNADKRGFEW